MYAMPSDLSKPGAVDVHFHVFDAHVAQPGARYVPGYDARLSAWQAAAAPLGITRGVLVQPSFLGSDHRRLRTELAAHPDTLRGVAVVAPSVSAAELAALHTAGVRAIRLNLVGTDHNLAAWQGPHAPWPQLAALGWHVELHTDRGALPAALAQLPADLPLVIDHMGKPDAAHPHDPTVRALAQRAQHTPVHVTLSGAYRLGGLDATPWRACGGTNSGPGRCCGAATGPAPTMKPKPTSPACAPCWTPGCPTRPNATRRWWTTPGGCIGVTRRSKHSRFCSNKRPFYAGYRHF